MSERAPYSRVYWSVMDDPKFDGIYEDDAAFALWMRLLMNADALWPAPAPLHRTAKARPLAKLVEAGIVDLLPRDRYRIHGLDSERGRRRDAALRLPKPDPVAPQLGTNRVPLASHARAIDETRRETPSQANTHANDDGRDDLEAFLVITRRAPTPKQRRLLDEVLDRHDLTGPAWSADIMFRHPDDPIGAVIEADKAYRAERIAAAQASEKPTPTPRRPRGLPQTTRDIMAEMAMLAKEPA